MGLVWGKGRDEYTSNVGMESCSWSMRCFNLKKTFSPSRPMSFFMPCWNLRKYIPKNLKRREREDKKGGFEKCLECLFPCQLMERFFFFELQECSFNCFCVLCCYFAVLVKKEEKSKSSLFWLLTFLSVNRTFDKTSVQTVCKWHTLLHEASCCVTNTLVEHNWDQWNFYCVALYNGWSDPNEGKTRFNEKF